MSNQNGFKLSRRKALASIGAVGVASAGAGLGTSAFFSDQESFEGNTITAGELDLRIDWQQLYWGMEYDHDQAPYGPAGRPFVNAHPDHDDDGMQSLNNDTKYVDGNPDDDMNWSKGDVEDGANIQDDLTCETLDNFEDPTDFSNGNGYEPDSLIHLEDVKPGDCGEVTFSYHLCDNPGYVWMLGQSTGEFDDELAEAIDVHLWYDLNCNNVFDDDQDLYIFESGSMAELFPTLTGGVQLDPSAYSGESSDGSGGGAGGECVKVGKVDVDDEGGFEDEVEGGSAIDGTHDTFVFDEKDDAPPWSFERDGDYEARDVTVKVEITEYKDEEETEPISFKASIVDEEPEFGLCGIRVKGGGAPGDDDSFNEFFELGDEEDDCVLSTDEIETNLRGPSGAPNNQTAISNIEFFVCDLNGDDDPQPNGCFDADETFCVGFSWCLPTDVDVGEIDGIDDINDLQGKSIDFDLGFYTEQCRHNDDPDGPSGFTD